MSGLCVAMHSCVTSEWKCFPDLIVIYTGLGPWSRIISPRWVWSVVNYVKYCLGQVLELFSFFVSDRNSADVCGAGLFGLMEIIVLISSTHSQLLFLPFLQVIIIFSN